MATPKPKKQSKYDRVFKLPISFDEAMGILAKPTKSKPKRRG
ncbi:MAG TPA: hypothetical protein VFM05_09130 [Candidatus Saccharimonadales bacterium]|nr:hypothetical protein [Candidatus Saccharimonadales bacterium]